MDSAGSCARIVLSMIKSWEGNIVGNVGKSQENIHRHEGQAHIFLSLFKETDSLLTASYYKHILFSMNRLPFAKRVLALRCLVEGMSVRATARTAEVSPVTVLKLLQDAGRIFADYQHRVLTELPCKHLELDEVWSFVWVKAHRKNKAKRPPAYAGNVWTWVAICRDTRLVPAWRVGDRTQTMANEFVLDLSQRMASRVQVTSDAYPCYLEAVRQAFEGAVDYAVLKKEHRTDSPQRKTLVAGNPELDFISTSIAERNNLTLRMSIRRFTRKTNAFSKRLSNHAHAVALHFMHYNFSRIHQTLQKTPAMAAGLTVKPYSIDDLVGMIEAAMPASPRGPYKKKGIFNL